MCKCVFLVVAIFCAVDLYTRDRCLLLLEAVALYLLVVGFFERLKEQIVLVNSLAAQKICFISNNPVAKGISRTIRNRFNKLCHQRSVNAKGEAASRDVLLKSELAAFVSAMEEAAQGICPKMRGPTGEVRCVSPVRAWSNRKYRELNSKNPHVMFIKNLQRTGEMYPE